jgi:hypothetical protein
LCGCCRDSGLGVTRSKARAMTRRSLSLSVSLCLSLCPSLSVCARVRLCNLARGAKRATGTLCIESAAERAHDAAHRQTNSERRHGVPAAINSPGAATSPVVVRCRGVGRHPRLLLARVRSPPSSGESCPALSLPLPTRCPARALTSLTATSQPARALRRGRGHRSGYPPAPYQISG